MELVGACPSAYEPPGVVHGILETFYMSCLRLTLLLRWVTDHGRPVASAFDVVYVPHALFMTFIPATSHQMDCLRAPDFVEPASDLACDSTHDDTPDIVVLAGPFAQRLSMKRLVQLSATFNEVFDPSASEDEAAGYPVFVITDTVYDFWKFFKYIYRSPDPGFRACRDFSTLAALLRVCVKYRVEKPLQDLKDRLYAIFPRTLGDWSTAERSMPFKYGSHNLAFEALNLVRLLGETVADILPGVLYYCALFDEDIIRQGAGRIDGTLETLSGDDVELVLAAQGIIMEGAVELSVEIILFDMHRGPLDYKTEGRAKLASRVDEMTTLLTDDPLRPRLVRLACQIYGGPGEVGVFNTVMRWRGGVWDRLVRLAGGHAAEPGPEA
ncbi:hypothetical protein C8T65DRAFT_745388 [Cerioporus squamosus]|nr:hypothetical protein C8T65DRAFT_745388 [Cerioporus squamosus]